MQKVIRERDIEHYLVNQVKALGGECRKIEWIGRRGAPDRLVMLPRPSGFSMINDTTIWIELKAPGVKLEPLGDGSAVLYSKDLDESLSLNHTAALLCSFADGQHTFSMILQELGQIFPQDSIDESALLQFVSDLEIRKFIQILQ
jgi:hypothetical protein